MLSNKILIKISGESFLDQNSNSNFNFKYLEDLVDQIILLKNNNKKIVIIVGGGNICRGNDLMKNFPTDFNSDPLDYAGMIATVINGIILKEIFIKKQIEVELLNAFKIDTKYTLEFSKIKAENILKNKKILILTGGKGKPGFSTDILVVEKAKELDINLILLGKNDVKGIFESDPKINKNSKFLSKILFKDIFEKKLKIMDLTAVKKGIEISNLEMIVFDIKNKNSIIKAFKKQGEFTYVSNK